MGHDRAFLTLAHELLKDGFAWSVKPGMRIARGFADVGFEEYSVLSEHAMVSLNTGQRGEIPPTYREHFFPVPTADEAAAYLYERSVDIEGIGFPDQRSWEIQAVKSGRRRCISSRSLEEGFLRLLVAEVKGELDV